MSDISKLIIPGNTVPYDLRDSGAVRFDITQTLTAAEKALARANIGAGTGSGGGNWPFYTIMFSNNTYTIANTNAQEVLSAGPTVHIVGPEDQCVSWVLVPDPPANSIILARFNKHEAIDILTLTDNNNGTALVGSTSDLQTYDLSTLNETQKGVPIYYGVCDTAASTAAKSITSTAVPEGWPTALTPGLAILTKFTYANSASTPTFSVNGQTAKNIKQYGTTNAAGSSLTTGWSAGDIVLLVYDGTYWRYNKGMNTNTDTTYNPAKLGFAYGTSSNTAGETARTATLSSGSYTLGVNGIVSIKFTTNVAANATLNIASKGAKPIFYRNAALPANIIHAGDVATFIYNGTQYHLIAIDHHIDSTVLLETSQIYVTLSDICATFGDMTDSVQNCYVSDGLLHIWSTRTYGTNSGTERPARNPVFEILELGISNYVNYVDMPVGEAYITYSRPTTGEPAITEAGYSILTIAGENDLGANAMNSQVLNASFYHSDRLHIKAPQVTLPATESTEKYLMKAYLHITLPLYGYYEAPKT